MLHGVPLKPITGTFVNMLISDTGIVNAGLKEWEQDFQMMKAMGMDQLFVIRTEMNAMLLQTHQQELITIVRIGQIDINLSVKTTHKRSIQYIRTITLDIIVRCRQNEHRTFRIRYKTIHLRQKRCERIFIVVSTYSAGTIFTDSIHLVDKNNRRRIASGLGKQIANILFC